MRSLLWYSLAAVAEIAGCFAFWAWLRLGRNPLMDSRRYCFACRHRAGIDAHRRGGCGPCLRRLWGNLYPFLAALALGC
jgi:hypothetical protein